MAADSGGIGMNISDLTNEERETCLSLVADNRLEWTVYSDDPVMIRKLDKIADGTAYGLGMKYTLLAGQVSLRKKRPPMSEEQREKARKRFAVSLGRKIAEE